VVELEVVVDEGWCRTLRDMPGQPARERLYFRYFVCLGAEVALDPAFHLAGEKTFRITKFTQPGRLPVDGVDLHQRLDHHVGDLAAQVFGWCHPWGKGVIQDDAFSAFHDVEGYT